MKKREDIRKERREIIQQQVGLEVFRPGAEGGSPVVFDGIGLDLSSEGICVMTELRVDEGQILKLLYPVNGRCALPVYSEVIWLGEGERFFRVGMRFLT
jgi:hypothetical protein